ncbi:hypothetical protein BJX64DRAFT_295097 [Aspergillus heterothallicus]
MKLPTALLTLTILTPTILSAPPTPNQKRSLTDYETIITDLTDATNDFSAWITQYASSSITGPELLSHSTDLLNAYIDVPGTIIQLAPLTTSDALALVDPILGLRDATGDMVDALISVKPDLVSEGLDDEFATWLGDLRGEMEGLRDAVVDKVPSVLADIVYDVLDSIPAEVRRGEDAFLE